MLTIRAGLTLHTRADWGARRDIPRLGYVVPRLKRTEAIIHHTVIIDNDATPNRWETLAEVYAKMRQLQTIRPDLGLDVPYNFVAFHMADGTLVICEGRGFDRTGAHTHGHNTEGMATAGEGNFQLGLPVTPYVGHWSRWLGYLKYDIGMANLGSVRPTSGPNAGAVAFGHKDLSVTACPGTALYAIIPVMSFRGATPTPAPAPTPEPPAEEGDVDMGKILDAAVVAGNAIVRGAELTEAELAKAMGRDEAPAPAPAPAPTPVPTPAPAPTGTTYMVKANDQLGFIALEYQSKWPSGMSLWGRDGAVAVLAAHNGIAPNAGLSVGQVLKIPW